MQVEKKILAEVMLIFVTSSIIYGLIGAKSLPMLLFWNIFIYMVIEDYKYRTVELRCVMMLVLFSAAGSESLKKYFLLLIAGLLIFRIIYLLVIKIYDADAVFKESSVLRSGHGYLPSLSVGLIIFLMLEKIFSPPKFMEFYKEVFEFILEIPELVAMTIILTVIMWLILEWRLWNAEKLQKKIIYGWGGGDVLVLGIMTGVIGAEKMYAIFFISLLIQLIEFASENVILGVRKI